MEKVYNKVRSLMLGMTPTIHSVPYNLKYRLSSNYGSPPRFLASKSVNVFGQME